MSSLKLFINDNLINRKYLPLDTGIPLALITRFFGIQIEWIDNNNFILKRGNQKIDLTLSNDKSISEELLTKHFNMSFFKDSDTLNIIDPLTFDYHKSFAKEYPVYSIQGFLLETPPNNNQSKCYIIYHIKESKSLSLAVINNKGTWLYNNYIHGTELKDISINKMSENNHLNIQTQDNNIHLNYLSNFHINDTGLLLKEVFLSKNDILVNLSDAREVAISFRDALFSRNESLAFILCSEHIDKFTLNNLLELHNLHTPINKQESIYCTIWHDGIDKLVLLTYLASFDLKFFRSPHDIIRLVLIKENGLWKIDKMANLGDTLPTSVINNDDINIEVKNDSLYTNFPKYYISLKEKSWIRIFCKSLQKTITRFDICCDYLEVTELLPGIEISFQESKKGTETGQFQSRYASLAKIEKISNYCYNLHVFLET